MMKHVLVSTLLTLTPVLAQSSETGAPSVQERVNEVMGLRASSLTDLSTVQLESDLFVAFEIEGVSALLHLRPHSVRSAGYQLLVQDANGNLVKHDPGPATTYRGTVLGIHGSRVAASMSQGVLFARLDLGLGESYWIEPVPEAFAAVLPGGHVLYRSSDVVEDTLHGCGVDRLAGARPVATQRLGGSAGLDGGGFSTCELACDADFEYFQDYGSVSAVEARINTVINTVNQQYESEVGITHSITTILVRTSSSDPYTSTDAVTLLNEFRDEWNANQGSIQRDVAQLFTGKSIDGGTIGIAWLGVICNSSFGYSMVESDFNNTFSCTTDLSAHELGHNWDADHCSCTSNTMNPFITCANTFHPSLTIPEIIAHRDSRTCLGGGPVATELVVSSVTTGTQSAGRGQKFGTASVTITDNLGNPVSGATVQGFFQGDFSESASGTTNGQGVVSFTTSTTRKGRLRFQFCVSDVIGSLPYNGGETCSN